MMKAIGLTALLAFAAQEKGGNPDLLYKQDLGVSIMKPIKNEEWEFKEKGFWSNSKVVVAHKVDTLMIDVYVQEKANNGYYDPKKIAEDAYNKITENKEVKDAKKNPVKATKLPNGTQAQLMEMTYKMGEKPMEFKNYAFVSGVNQQLYIVSISGDEGTYKKHEKNITFILSTLKIYKVK